MTIVELLSTLSQLYPHGVSLDPMTLRLLRKKVAIEDWQLEIIKKSMFLHRDSSGRELWFTKDMAMDASSLSLLQKKAYEWLAEYGFFSVESLVAVLADRLQTSTRNTIVYPLLSHLGYEIVDWKGHKFCSQSSIDITRSLATTAQEIQILLNDDNGLLSVQDILQHFPHLALEVLENIRVSFLPEIGRSTEGNIECWRHAESVYVPSDFSDQITNIIDILWSLNEKITANNLGFALNLFYQTKFREEYVLDDDKIFLRICQKYYQGKNSVFSRTRPNPTALQERRSRSANTRFVDIGVPIGATLNFTRDNGITCEVADAVSSVKYRGETWAISALANHLSRKTYLNGFYYFTYEGEILFNRRKRLEEQCQSVLVVAKLPPRTSLPEMQAPLERDALSLPPPEKELNGRNVLYSTEKTKNTKVSGGEKDLSQGVDGQSSGISRIDNVGCERGNQFLRESTLRNVAVNEVDIDEDVGGITDETGANVKITQGKTFQNRAQMISTAQRQVYELSCDKAQRNDECNITGLSGEIISKSTWRNFMQDGNDARVSKWIKKNENGICLDEIAEMEGLQLSTVKRKISNYYLYYKVCEKNDIIIAKSKKNLSQTYVSSQKDEVKKISPKEPESLAVDPAVFARFKREFSDILVRKNVAEWVRRVEAGEKMSNIAREYNYTYKAVKNLIEKYRLCMKKQY